MKFLIIRKALQGYIIKDSINDVEHYYIGYTLKQAIRQHRKKHDVT